MTFAEAHQPLTAFKPWTCGSDNSCSHTYWWQAVRCQWRRAGRVWYSHDVALRMTALQFAQWSAGKGPARAAKYGNRKTRVDNLTFDSSAEARRYQDLLLLQRAGEIRDLDRQVTFRLVVNGVLIAKYYADFTYEWRQHDTWVAIVEDVKSEPTRARNDYQMKRKLMLALHGIAIREVE